MSNPISSKDLLDLAKNLKSLLIMCEIENSVMLDILSNVTSSKSYQLLSIHHQISKACGDNPDNSQNKKSNTTNLDPKTSHKEHLIKLIKNADKDNLRLRESNVKLKQESKIQDKKIRDFNRKIMVNERNNHENQLQRVLLRDLKSTAQEKAAEIVLLKQKLENVKALVSQEKAKTRNFQEHQRKSPKSRDNQQLSKASKSKVEELLKEIDLLLEESEQGSNMSYFMDENWIEKTLKTLKKIEEYSAKLNEDGQSICKGFGECTGSNFNQNSEMPLSMRDVGTQTSDETVFEEDLCKRSVVSNEDEMYISQSTTPLN